LFGCWAVGKFVGEVVTHICGGDVFHCGYVVILLAVLGKSIGPLHGFFVGVGRYFAFGVLLLCPLV
jgi:hypothetical protein